MQFLPDLIPEAEMLQDQLFVFPIFRPRTRTSSVRDFIFKLRSSRKSKTALRSGFQNNVKQTFGQPLGVLDTLLIPELIIRMGWMPVNPKPIVDKWTRRHS